MSSRGYIELSKSVNNNAKEIWSGHNPHGENCGNSSTNKNPNNAISRVNSIQSRLTYEIISKHEMDVLTHRIQ